MDRQDVEKRHKQERRDLQAKVTHLKRSAVKGDTKRKREIAKEIAQLEADLERCHEKELAKFATSSSVDQLESMLETVTCEDGSDIDSNFKSNRISKAKKRRDKKEQKDKEREELIRQQEELNVIGSRNVEYEALNEMLRLRNLQIHEMTVSELRQQTANFIRHNKDDFMPFLCDQDSGLPFTDEKFEAYCEEIETTPVWGGQLELRAISQVIKHPIEVLQAAGQPLTLGDEFESQPIIITYHRHAYKLGEHFNSVVPATNENDGYS